MWVSGRIIYDNVNVVVVVVDDDDDDDDDDVEDVEVQDDNRVFLYIRGPLTITLFMN